MLKQEDDKAMTSEYPIEWQAAYLIQDFLRLHFGGGVQIVDAYFVQRTAAILAGEAEDTEDPTDIDFKLTVLIEDAIDNYGDGCVAAPMAVAELVRQIRTLEIR